ncbi:MAG: BON domain-containing protein [Myxococcaceae bacterium]|jgi:hyperosmotically inducible protein|nr:BON domain-containing protein [Myxococcaceae bacterium]
MRTVALVSSVFFSTAAAAAPDGLITAKVKLALLTTGGLRSHALHVDTSDGDVTLFGTVSSAMQRDTSERVVRTVEGVRSVQNLLQLVDAAPLTRVLQSDRETRALVDARLGAETALKASHILVHSVDTGVVLLVGEATSVSDHLRAVWLTGKVPGVVRVISEVRAPDGFIARERLQAHGTAALPVDSASDMRISADVKLRLLTSREVPSTELAVDTEDGVVTLFGMVETEALRASAGAAAQKANNVVRVVNELQVVPGSTRAPVESSDAAITRDLALALATRPGLEGVRAQVKNGLVRLSGVVATGWDELLVVRLARRVPGVRGVDDQLHLEP